MIRERPSGDFSRTLTLSEGLDASKLAAQYHNGVLILTIPVAEMAMSRKVTIGSRPQTAVIEAPENDETPEASETAGHEAHVHTN